MGIKDFNETLKTIRNIIFEAIKSEGRVPPNEFIFRNKIPLSNFAGTKIAFDAINLIVFSSIIQVSLPEFLAKIITDIINSIAIIITIKTKISFFLEFSLIIFLCSLSGIFILIFA